MELASPTFPQPLRRGHVRKDQQLLWFFWRPPDAVIIATMATYLVMPDDYAGWNPTGRNFALAGGAIGFVGLLSYLSLHHRLGEFRPSAASDELFLQGLVWLGGGAFFLMGFAAAGSIMLSLKSRGTVNVSDEGVSRQGSSHIFNLAWQDIEGFVPMPYGGVTLISTTAEKNLVIPRFLDDYRACIAEIKQHGVGLLPPSRLRQRRQINWRDQWKSCLCVFFYTFAIGTHEPRVVQVSSCAASGMLWIWMLREEWTKPDQTGSRWTGVVVSAGFLLYLLWRVFLRG